MSLPNLIASYLSDLFGFIEVGEKGEGNIKNAFQTLELGWYCLQI